jgi:translation initiation factor IF-2
MTDVRGPGGREGSTQFSLKELLRLEDERVEEQRHASALAAAQAREAEARRAASAAADARAAESERERRRKAELDDVAAREARAVAAVEQARLQVDVRARAEERELERRHELELERLRGEAAKSKLAPLAGASLLGAGVMLVVLLAIDLGVSRPAQAHVLAEEQARTIAAETRATDAVRQLDEQRKTIAALEARFQKAEAAPVRPPSATTPGAASGATSGAIGPRRPQVPTRPRDPEPDVICQKGDPMCPSIGR